MHLLLNEFGNKCSHHDTGNSKPQLIIIIKNHLVISLEEVNQPFQFWIVSSSTQPLPLALYYVRRKVTRRPTNFTVTTPGTERTKTCQPITTIRREVFNALPKHLETLESKKLKKELKSQLSHRLSTASPSSCPGKITNNNRLRLQFWANYFVGGSF